MKYIGFGLAIVMMTTLAGCGGKGGSAGSKYGKAIPTTMAATPAKDILAAPKDFEGKEVLVSGKITSECPSGGWVWLQAGAEQLYVNMHPTNVFIPQRVGKTVKAIGKVVLVEGRPQVVGDGLEF